MIRLVGIVIGVALVSAAARPTGADPCGMVSPFIAGGGPVITRVGAQITYVFYKQGIESFVIRPGFSGKVEQFGMLIPFPTPPAVRKVEDDIFAHVAAAIDPPELVVYVRPQDYDFNPRASASKVTTPFSLGIHEVRVLRQEAVGMYDVAVLEAGSAAALKRWMTDHGFRYPDGMDKVCDEYVALRWCFVAVKTRVGRKSDAEPRPGQRDADPRLPAGATFDGHVQAMGFRFRTPELVVPMRLSAFNEGRLRNVVYLLAEGPQAIRDIPRELVVRQVSGQVLHRNLTGRLPVRIWGGSARDIPANLWASLRTQREQTPHNGFARDLFSSDLAAARTGRLAQEHEEEEKLLAMRERVGLRGTEIDALHRRAVEAARKETFDRALVDLGAMTMTVVDGDFPREVLSRENLRFDRYGMPEGRNHPGVYDARLMRPDWEYGRSALYAGVHTPAPVSVLYTGPDLYPDPPPPPGKMPLWVWLGLVACLVAGVSVIVQAYRPTAAGHPG